jgi:hypothetical protein
MLKTIIAFISAFALAGTVAAGSYEQRMYEVTVTNITKGQSFTPILAATHHRSISFFELGDPVSEELATIAEGGNTAPLQAVLEASPQVVSTTGTAGLLAPGNTVSFEISAERRSRLSFAAMLLPTNDTFVSVDAVALPRWGSRVYFAQAYDAGSEINDESCANIPGPTCGGAGFSAEDGEGFVHLAAGISGEGDLAASAYDWRGAVAKVVIKRIY